ncbi:MAG TPA: M36 family metallopeptidase, partial [Actinomycetota bacterium]|nr:M36 family metallopeptidase [Actinomycetota bacterium]
MHGTFLASRRPAIPMVLAIVAVAAALTVPAGAAGERSSVRPVGFQGENGLPADIDTRQGRDGPSAGQRAEARALDATVRWNEFGTPQSLINHGGFLATGLSTDPVEAATSFLADNRELFRLSAQELSDLEVVAVNPIGKGSAVLLRQRIGGLPASPEGLVAVGVREGKITYVSSSLTGETSAPPGATLSAEQALIAAARNLGRDLGAAGVDPAGSREGWRTFRADGFTGRQLAQLVAVPTPDQGVRSAYQTYLADADSAAAFTHFVDASTGEILIRHNEVDFAGEPKWDFFEGYPPVDYSTTDTRVTWCWTPAPDCDVVIAQDPLATPLAWDVDPATGVPTNTSLGNNARGTEKWHSNVSRDLGTVFATPRPGRDYQYSWTNQWFEERCDPAVFTSAQKNDIDAAIANLFVGHNLMHDWSYRLGFTESAWNAQIENFDRGGAEADPEHGNAQAGGVVGGPPGFQSRDNANQFSGPDGAQPVTNMYLWQPIAAAFYAPCVDGDYDMSVIGHEYGHLISNRMVAGPMTGLGGNQGGAMGESWSDLLSMEVANEHGWVPIGGESPYAVGPYVTGDPHAAIRNYNMSQSPLNYSDVGYDFVCNDGSCTQRTQVHADGEIWSATNFDIRQAMIQRHGAGSAAQQLACANGTAPAGSCPGNRRWIQLVFDSYLLIAIGQPSMLDARDALLAADLTRFGGANQDLLWNAFARRGFGSGASSGGGSDFDPIPDFTSPHATEGTVVFRPKDDSDTA